MPPRRKETTLHLDAMLSYLPDVGLLRGRAWLLRPRGGGLTLVSKTTDTPGYNILFLFSFHGHLVRGLVYIRALGLAEPGVV